MTTLDFINKADVKHNNKYNYSKVNYINAKTNVTIICQIHGEFTQRPSSHLSGCGCPKCSWVKLSCDNSDSLDMFIHKANLKHSSRYNYNNTMYTNTNSKVTITCLEHGDFSQRASAHLSGQGCPKCGINSSTSKLTSNTINFVSKATIVHDNRYLYTNTTYTKSRDKVYITCRIHGDFEQTANEHLKGHGCPYCAKSSSLQVIFNKHKNTETTFYVIKFSNLFKIGITISDVHKRYRQEVQSINDIELVYTKTFNSYKSAYDYEQYVLSINKQNKYTGIPLFKKTGTTEILECFPVL